MICVLHKYRLHCNITIFMKMFMRFLKITSCFFFCQFTIEAKNNNITDSEPGIALSDELIQNMRVVILSPADSIINGYPLLKVKPPEDTISEIVYNLFENSFMRQSVRLYYLIQNFLINKGELESYEPAYLLLSQNQGGFPKFGFFLFHGDSVYDKTNVHYIELVKNNNKTENHLGSMTQIYPHELGHVFYYMLSSDSDTTAMGSIDVHYSTLTTDYRTAFNEGFAIHFENMSRKFEPDTTRMYEIKEDLLEKKKQVVNKIKG